VSVEVTTAGTGTRLLFLLRQFLQTPSIRMKRQASVAASSIAVIIDGATLLVVVAAATATAAAVAAAAATTVVVATTTTTARRCNRCNKHKLLLLVAGHCRRDSQSHDCIT